MAKTTEPPSRKVDLSFDPASAEDCQDAIDKVLTVVAHWHGWKPVQKRVERSRHTIKQNNNVMLMGFCLFAGSLGMSERAFAARIAKINGRTPRGYRFGPYGSTSAEALLRQIKRLKKLLRRDPKFRKLVSPFTGDILK